MIHARSRDASLSGNNIVNSDPGSLFRHREWFVGGKNRCFDATFVYGKLQ